MQENKDAIEYILSVLDETERSITGDVLSERNRIVRYDITFPPEEKKPAYAAARGDVQSDVPAIRDCHRCSLWMNRGEERFELPKRRAKVMFIVSAPETKFGVLDNDAMDMFQKQVAAIGLTEQDYILTSLMKCPTRTFKTEEADICRGYLKDEMVKASSVKCFVFLGSDISSYMLRRPVDMDAFRARVWNINGIPSVATYSERECLVNPALKRPVWEDLKKVRGFIG